MAHWRTRYGIVRLEGVDHYGDRIVETLRFEVPSWYVQIWRSVLRLLRLRGKRFRLISGLVAANDAK